MIILSCTLHPDDDPLTHGGRFRRWPSQSYLSISSQSHVTRKPSHCCCLGWWKIQRLHYRKFRSPRVRLSNGRWVLAGLQRLE